MHKVKWIYLSIWWSLLAGIIAGIPLQNSLLSLMSFFGAVFWWFFGLLISRLVAVLSTSSIRCKHCGLEIPAVGRWQIGSFTDHRDRHIYAAKSPLDGNRVGHINCPQCDCTILV
jgi:hypothetical protein